MVWNEQGSLLAVSTSHPTILIISSSGEVYHWIEVHKFGFFEGIAGLALKPFQGSNDEYVF